MWKSVGKRLFGPAYIGVQLDLTNACNLQCKHCYHPHHNNDDVLSLRQWLEVLSRIERFSKRSRAIPKFHICGGEPTLSPAFSPVMLAIKRSFPSSPINVLTNGTLLDSRLHETVLDVMSSCRSSVQLSFEGAAVDAHDQIRGKGAFDLALRGAMAMRTRGIPYSIQAVLTRNTACQIPAFFFMAKAMGAYAMDFVRLVGAGSAIRYAAESNLHLRGEELKKAMQEILVQSRTHSIPTQTFGPLWALVDANLGSADRLGFYSVIVDYQGYLKVSSRTPLRIGHILQDDIWRVLTRTPILQSLRRGEIDGCRDCLLFKNRRCSGDRNVAYASSGSYLGPDVGCWKWRSENDLDEDSKESSEQGPSYPNGGFMRLPVSSGDGRHAC